MRAVKLVEFEDELSTAFRIREKVFVDEQHVSHEEEFDDFDQVCYHFIAYYDGQACGTARWRFTDDGIKLERFAILESFRGKKVGSALLNKVLNHVQRYPERKDQRVYLHAQLFVIPLYEKAGFKPIGEVFDECGIPHQLMELYLDP